MLLWLCVLAVCGMIWCFSAQDGEASAHTSGRVLGFAVMLLSDAAQAAALVENQSLYETASWLIRKGAHFAEFALLAFFVRLLLHSYRARRGWLWAWLAASFYAVTDEVHQFYMAARDASLLDVGIDSLGAAAGAALAGLAVCIWQFFSERKKARSQMQGLAAGSGEEPWSE